MKLLKISFLLTVLISLCSFAYLSVEEGREQLYNEFLNEFDKVKIPSSFSLKSDYYNSSDINLQKQKNTVSKTSDLKKKKQKPRKVLRHDYAAFIPDIKNGLMSRMGPSTYEAEKLLVSNKVFSAIIYSESRSYRYASKSFYLATFDNQGNQIDTKFIGYSEPSVNMVLAVSKDLNIKVKKKNVKINKDLAKHDTLDKNMFITPNGKIKVHSNINENNKPRIKLG